jgi:hypothetical protein
MFRAAKMREEQLAKERPKVYGGDTARRRIQQWERSRLGW